MRAGTAAGVTERTAGAVASMEGRRLSWRRLAAHGSRASETVRRPNIPRIVSPPDGLTTNYVPWDEVKAALGPESRHSGTPRAGTVEAAQRSAGSSGPVG